MFLPVWRHYWITASSLWSTCKRIHSQEEWAPRPRRGLTRINVGRFCVEHCLNRILESVMKLPDERKYQMGSRIWCSRYCVVFSYSIRDWFLNPMIFPLINIYLGGCEKYIGGKFIEYKTANETSFDIFSCFGYIILSWEFFCNKVIDLFLKVIFDTVKKIAWIHFTKQVFTKLY